LLLFRSIVRGRCNWIARAQKSIPTRADSVQFTGILAPEFLLLLYEIQDAGTMTEETGLFPHTDPALSDDGVVPVLGLSHSGKSQRHGEAHVSVQVFFFKKKFHTIHFSIPALIEHSMTNPQIAFKPTVQP
jgi:hypothetical protein